MKTRSKAALWFLSVAILGATLVWLSLSGRINVESNILELLPENQADPAVREAFDSFSNTNFRQLVFLVENDQLEQGKVDAESLVAALSDSVWIADVSATISTTDQTEISQFVYQYRHQLLSPPDAALLEGGDFETFAADTLQRVFSPLTGSVIELVATDPYLLSFRFISSAGPVGFQSMTLDGDYLVGRSNGMSYVLVTASLTQSPFNPAMHADLLGRLEVLEGQWDEQNSGSSLIRTGALFYTADAYRTAQSEVSRFGGASLLLVLALVIVVFRSPTPLLMVALTLGFGICAGFAVVRLVFGEVHLLTIVFGASLIGVAVDYAFHYFAVDGDYVGDARLSAVFSAITLGLCSSIIGYMALLTTPFPGLQQMAVFCIVGLAGAYATVVLLYPQIPWRSTRNQMILRACGAFLKLGDTSGARNVWRVLLLTPLIALGMIVMEDYRGGDIREFQAVNPALESQESRIASVLNNPTANQFFLVRDESADSLLQTLESTIDDMDGLVARGVIDGYLSVSPWLTSTGRQQGNYALIGSLYDSPASDVLVDAGLLTGEEYDQAVGAYAEDSGDYLLPDAWLESQLGERFGSLWIGRIGEEYFSIIALQGVNDLAALSDLSERVTFVDQVSTVNDLLEDYRQIAMSLLLVAGALILLVLTWRFGFATAALVLSSPVIAASVTVISIHLLAGSVNLFNVLALFLVIGIGIDFGIFFAEVRTPGSSTLLAVLLSALTTMFSFGMLSLSSTSVIQSFGQTMLVGIATVLLLSPIIGTMVSREGIRSNE